MKKNLIIRKILENLISNATFSNPFSISYRAMHLTTELAVD